MQAPPNLRFGINEKKNVNAKSQIWLRDKPKLIVYLYATFLILNVRHNFMEQYLTYKNGILTNQKDINSLSEYLDFIESLKKIWGSKWLYYRGISNGDYELIPSIYRQKSWSYTDKIASEIFVEFKRKVSGFTDTKNYSDWRYYELMQHYGFPTRLLDWTCGSLIAVFFSLLNLNKCKDPCIWVLDPLWLNNKSVGQDYVFSTESTDDKSLSILTNYLYDKKLSYQLPIAVLPANHNSRILAQKSAFTVHGILTNGLEKMFEHNDSTRLCKLTFNNSLILEIKSALISSGINYSNIFPDVTGLCEELKFEYQLD